MKNLLSAARGDKPCDLVIKGGRVANVLSLEYETADIAVKDGLIVGVGAGYEGGETIDAAGCVLMPGMIDGHLHIESTMLPPAAFASAVVPLGTTTVMPDPHEIANACGVEGIEFMRRESLRAPLDAFYAAPSCVPASEFETPYREIGAMRLLECCDRGLCTHLGEMMNFPGVISGDGEVWAKITGSRGMVRTAHAPNVTGRDLCAYLLSGCDGDHESNSAGEALEKLRRGMWVMMREGATEHNLEDLLPLILEDESRFARCMAVSDDLTASVILSSGHMDRKVRLMIERGVRPLIAAAMVTINPADYFRLHDRGAIAPGRIADIVMVTSLEECRAVKVWKRGNLVASNGNALFEAPPPSVPDLPPTRRLDVVPGEMSFKVPSEPGNIRVIEAISGSVLTRSLSLASTTRDGFVVSDTERDILKLAVTEKNRGTGRTAVGFVKGFGLKRGAIGSSVAHDAHNYVVMGADDKSIATAIKFLAENNGGLVASLGGEVISSVPLPIGGLMSIMSPRELSDALSRITQAAERDLGASISQPFMAMSFLSLSVIPELKLTDQGYVNISEGGVKGIFVQKA
jgi:adenine deaminase